MKIVLIGTGNVASHLGPALKAAGLSVLQVFGRSQNSTAALAKKLSCPFTLDPTGIAARADVYIIALRDEAIASFAGKMPETNGIVVHTSGSVPLTVLQKKFAQTGVIYPLQTFSISRKVNLSKVPFCIEADSVKTERKLKALIRPLSENIHVVDSNHRLVLHLAAVIANNFSNHLFTLAENLLLKNNLDFALLRPLILETAQKVQQHSPNDMQTGPARRGDTATIEKHIGMLKGQPYLQDIYRLLTESIEDLSGPLL